MRIDFMYRKVYNKDNETNENPKTKTEVKQYENYNEKIN